MNDLIWKREGEAFKAEIDDKLDNTEEHDNDNDDMSDENTVARNSMKEKEIEIDAANDVTERNDEENDKTRAEIDDKLDNTEEHDYDNDDMSYKIWIRRHIWE